MSTYPEHEKLRAVRERSQACGEFLEWLGEKGIRLARPHEHTPECYAAHVCGRDCVYTSCGRQKGGPRERDELVCGTFEGAALYAIHEPMTKLLAEFFGIDENRLEAEKRAMLDELRRAHGER